LNAGLVKVRLDIGLRASPSVSFKDFGLRIFRNADGELLAFLRLCRRNGAR
jgi:hypothetical protein